MILIEFKGKPFINQTSSVSQENQIFSYNLLKEVTDELSFGYLMHGKGVFSSALHLSIKDVDSAVMKLLRTNELYYAFVLTQLFDVSSNDIVMQKMAENAIFIDEKNYARNFINKIKKMLEMKELYLGALGSSLKEVSPGLKKLEDYKNLAKGCLSKFNYMGAVINNILAKNSDEAFAVACDFAKSTGILLIDIIYIFDRLYID